MIEETESIPNLPEATSLKGNVDILLVKNAFHRTEIIPTY